jgi:hypothetical protein
LDSQHIHVYADGHLVPGEPVTRDVAA